MTMPQRIMRRVARSIAGAATQSEREQMRRDAIEAVEAELQAIAELKQQMGALAVRVAAHEETIRIAMEQHKLGPVTNGVLEAALIDTYSNEKKEIDPLKLFNLKGINRTDFFKMVKVQIGEVGKFLSENEIRGIANITPPQKTGTALVIKPVKQASSKTIVKKARK